MIYRSFILLAPLLETNVATLPKQGIQQMSDNHNKSNQNTKPYENIFPLKYILPKLMRPRAFFPKHKYGLIFDLWKSYGGFLFPERGSPKSSLNVQNKVFHNLSHVLLFNLFPLTPAPASVSATFDSSVAWTCLCPHVSVLSSQVLLLQPGNPVPDFPNWWTPPSSPFSPSSQKLQN